MLLGNKQLLGRQLTSPTVSFLGKKLTPLTSAKDLRVILDSHLTYDSHISQLVSSHRVKNNFDKETLSIMITSLVFNYFSLYKGSCLNLKIIWLKRVRFFVFLRCAYLYDEEVVRYSEKWFQLLYWNGWMEIYCPFWYTNLVHWHTNTGRPHILFV